MATIFENMYQNYMLSRHVLTYSVLISYIGSYQCWPVDVWYTKIGMYCVIYRVKVIHDDIST